jgi:D-glycero-alpha-D-manno-heptose-7-phosphate kinase
MLIARAPVRISFAGGGTDGSDYYSQYGGMVVSTSIDKYFYTIIHNVGNGATQIISADYKTLFTLDNHHRSSDLIWEGDLILPKAILAHFDLNRGQNVFIASEVPPGTGLGSSSAAAVCMIKAFATYKGQEINKQETADLACHIEINKLGMPIGKQDQYASAFGGLNQVEFLADGNVNVTPLRLSSDTSATLQNRLLLFFTGISRHSTAILEKQKAAVQKEERHVINNLHAIKQMAIEVKKCLESGDLDGFSDILHEGWERKKLLSKNISNDFINESYEVAIQTGARSGKITGAGGGGFLLLYCPQDRQPAVTAALEARGLKRMYARFENRGAHVLLDNLNYTDEVAVKGF